MIRLHTELRLGHRQELNRWEGGAPREGIAGRGPSVGRWRPELCQGLGLSQEGGGVPLHRRAWMSHQRPTGWMGRGSWGRVGGQEGPWRRWGVFVEKMGLALVALHTPEIKQGAWPYGPPGAPAPPIPTGRKWLTW